MAGGWKQSPEWIAKRIKRGEEHYRWAGVSVSPKAGRIRARNKYKEIGPCVNCGKEKAERHHVDGNTANNEPSNIRILCRKCHMQEDGRLRKLILRNQGNANA